MMQSFHHFTISSLWWWNNCVCLQNLPLTGYFSLALGQMYVCEQYLLHHNLSVTIIFDHVANALFLMPSCCFQHVLQSRGEIKMPNYILLPHVLLFIIAEPSLKRARIGTKWWGDLNFEIYTMQVIKSLIHLRETVVKNNPHNTNQGNEHVKAVTSACPVARRRQSNHFHYHLVRKEKRF